MDIGTSILRALRRMCCASLLMGPSWLTAQTDGVGLVVLGNVQDGGYPHIGCERPDCRNLFLRPATPHHVVSLGVVDRDMGRQFLFEATPDLTRQAFLLSQEAGGHDGMPDGIFLTHAHLGHYSGLGFLGREAMGAKDVPVFAMPRLRDFFGNQWPMAAARDIEQHRSEWTAGQPNRGARSKTAHDAIFGAPSG